MADIALINRDITMSSIGDILVADDNDDIIQMAANNIITIYGTNQFHPGIGNMVYHGRHKISENGLKEIAARCKDAIMLDYRVANVIEVIARNASTFEYPGLCEISFVLITIQGVQLSNNVTISLL